ncbi:MAG: alcohol dehydrogenase catalytic domain-containing protein [Acidobacteriia bacterium]|nr:alcohol dehydrogenase catalytic domain-containing protein [Terriglobia bacterium]
MHWEIFLPTASSSNGSIPGSMRAAVYTGNQQVSVQSVPVPEIGPGELLVRVHCCGICHTDLKKIEHDLLPAPRIYGHETAGEVVAAGAGVSRFHAGDRVAIFHHIPCLDCFYCTRRFYAQCPGYKKVGVTAGYEPAGGGFAQYVRVMDWIVRAGVEKIPDGVSYERASFVEPVNTCLKAVVMLDPKPDDMVLILGQGPIGLIFTMLVKRLGARILATDTIASRLALAVRFGAIEALNPRQSDVVARARDLTGGRGADIVIVAVSAPGLVQQAVLASRPGSKILLFAQTSDQERIELSGADICKGERVLLGSYSAALDLQQEAARLVFSGELALEELVSHRVSLPEVSDGFHLALHPDAKSLKIIVQPQRWSHSD